MLYNADKGRKKIMRTKRRERKSKTGKKENDNRQGEGSGGKLGTKGEGKKAQKKTGRGERCHEPGVRKIGERPKSEKPKRGVWRKIKAGCYVGWSQRG